MTRRQGNDRIIFFLVTYTFFYYNYKLYDFFFLYGYTHTFLFYLSLPSVCCQVVLFKCVVGLFFAYNTINEWVHK